MGAVDEFKGHDSRPVIGIFCTTGETKPGVAAERDKLESATVGTAIHGTDVRRITAAYYLFDVFHNNRSWLKVIFNDFMIIFQHFLYYVHEVIMKQKKAKNKPTPPD